VAKPSSVKRLIKSFVERFNSAAYPTGVQIVPVASSVRFGPALKRLKALGLHPATVFDVGVAYGTPDIYHEFRDAKYHLIDPVPQTLPYMQRWATKLNASIHNIGLGEADAVMPIDVWEEIDGSTFFKEVGQGPDYHSVLVPVKRFDSVFSAKDMVRPCMLKIDVQGAELSVLKGVGELIKDIDLMIVETRLINTQVGGAHLFEVLDYLRSYNFTIYDVCGTSRRSLDNALTEIDVVFCPADSFLLKDKRWS
jgi:FkbM family methyltransferase